MLNLNGKGNRIQGILFYKVGGGAGREAVLTAEDYADTNEPDRSPPAIGTTP